MLYSMFEQYGGIGAFVGVYGIKQFSLSDIDPCQLIIFGRCDDPFIIIGQGDSRWGCLCNESMAVIRSNDQLVTLLRQRKLRQTFSVDE